MSTILSRRLFLRSAAIMTAGFASVLAGCQPEVSREEQVVGEEVEEEIEEELEEEEEEEIVEEPEILASEAGAGDIVLNYWNYLVGDDGITMVNMMDLYTEENPEVTIKMQRIPGDTLREKIMAALAAGNAPELYFGLSAPAADIINWAKQGLFMILDDLFEVGTLSRDDYIEGTLETGMYDGHQQVLPIGGLPKCLWCNVEVFEEAGVEFGPTDRPMTREEFLETATAITRDSNGNHPGDSGFDPQDIEVWAYGGLFTQEIVAYQNGCDEVTMDGTCEPMILEDGWIDSIEWERDLIHKHYVKADQHWSADEHALINNSLAMHSIGSWHYNFWNTTHPQLKHGLLFWPTIGDEPGTTNALHSVNSFDQVKGEKREWALDCLNFIGDSHLWAAEAGIPPIRKSLSEHPEVKENWALPLQIEAMENSFWPNTSYPCPTEVAGVVGPKVQEAINQEVEPRQAMQDVLPRVEQILDRCCENR